jgi:hypothetical protein
MFGIQMQDILMQERIQQQGLTVAEASQLRKQGALPVELAKAWDEYDAWLARWCKTPEEGMEP